MRKIVWASASSRRDKENSGQRLRLLAIEGQPIPGSARNLFSVISFFKEFFSRPPGGPANTPEKAALEHKAREVII